MSFAQPFRDYEILDRLGAGAMGTVFKARHLKLSRIVALKVLRPSLARDARYVERLRREARIVAALNHPNIVTGYDLGEEGGYHYFVMELVEGRSLRALLAEWGIFSEDQVRNVATQVASALDHAFLRNVIHRDIKPGNILIDDAGAVKVTDMGLAKGPADLSLTRDGSTVGTPQYISPEQARNPQDADIRSDLYSLGATLYHMATGQPPFQGASMTEVILQVLHDTPVSPRVINPELSEGMSLVIRKLLSKSPQLRYQTPRELLDDLQRLARDQRPQVDESRLSVGETGRPPQTRKYVAAIAAALALVAAGFWLGANSATAVVEPMVRAEFPAAVEAELQTLGTPGQRWGRFLARTKDAPVDAAEWRQQTQRRLSLELQQELDRFVLELRAAGWTALAADADDPQRWPSGPMLARDHATGPLAQRLGISRDQLPSSVDTRALDAALTEIEELARRRDQSLLEQARRHLEVDTPMRADERVRQGDYAVAERVWREAFLGFFDGLRRPLPDRLPQAVRAALEERFEKLREQGLAQVDAAERRAAAALRSETEAALVGLVDEPGTAAASPRAIADRMAAVSLLREQLTAAYPPASRFRAANDPWHEVGAMLTGVERQLQAAFADAERVHEEEILDLAWRALMDGNSDAGLGVLLGARSRQADESDPIEPHREAMRAAGLVARAVLSALETAPPPIPGYPRNGGVAVELRALAGGRLEARIGAGHWRQAQLLEFRFSDLWQRAQESGKSAFAALDARLLRIGKTALAMACDQLDAVADGLDDLDRAFLRDEVWPRLLRVRGYAPGSGEDRAMALQRLREALARGRERNDPREVEMAVAQWQASSALTASDAERAVAREATDWIARESRRQELAEELRRRAPFGSVVAVDGEVPFLASVQVPASSMRSAGEGWQLREGRMEHAGSAQSWSDAQKKRLVVDAGLSSDCRQASLSCEFALPASVDAAPLHVFSFRSAACVVFATGDGQLRAAIVPDLDKGEPAIRAAVQRAVHAAMDRRTVGPSAIPLALHSLRFSIQSAPGRRACTTVVSIDGVELCRSFVDGADASPPTFAVYPLQYISVRMVRIEAAQ